MYNRPWLPMIPYLVNSVTGTNPDDDPGLFKKASPLYFVQPQSPATLILQGGRDNIVDASQSRLLKAKLEAAGTPHDLVLYPNEGHGWYGTNLSHSFDKIEAFLEKYVK